MTDVKEITCPECERVWPIISEQGIVTEFINKCYACFIAEVVKARDSRMETADYLIQNCANCGGLAGKVEKCTYCFGKGWEAVDKPDEDDTPRIAYPH
jgi:hypothetical protein